MPYYTTDGSTWTTPAIPRIIYDHILTTDAEALPECVPPVLVAAGAFPLVATGPYSRNFSGIPDALETSSYSL